MMELFHKQYLYLDNRVIEDWRRCYVRDKSGKVK